jgi:recombination protein RecA
MTVTLDEIVKEIKKQTDSDSITKGEDYADPADYVSTGNMALDWALGGDGFAFKFVIQLLGESRSGKTALMMETAGNAQDKYNAYVVWGDREGAFTRAFAEKLGMDMSKVILAEAYDLETPKEGFNFFKNSIRVIREKDPEAYIVICLDSLAAFSPGQEGEDMGKVAKQNHRGFREFLPYVDKKVMVLFANQITYKIGILFGNPKTSTGGTAPIYYSSYILELDPGKLIKDEGNRVVGQYIAAEVVKTRLGPAHRGVKIPFDYDSGFSWYGGFMRMLVHKGILTPTNKQKFKSGLPCDYKHNDTDEKYHEDEVERLLKDHPKLAEDKASVVIQSNGEDEEDA